MPAAGVKDGAKPDSWGVSSSLASSALCERPVAQGPMKRLQPSVGAYPASAGSPSGGFSRVSDARNSSMCMNPFYHSSFFLRNGFAERTK